MTSNQPQPAPRSPRTAAAQLIRNLALIDAKRREWLGTFSDGQLAELVTLSKTFGPVEMLRRIGVCGVSVTIANLVTAELNRHALEQLQLPSPEVN